MGLDTTIIAISRNKLPLRKLPYLIWRFARSRTHLDAFFGGKLEPKYRSRYLIISSLLGLLLAGLSLWLFYLLVKVDGMSFGSFLYNVKDDKVTGLITTSSFFYVLAGLIGIIPSFALWSFRNYNRMQELETARLNHENSRKDTNLKDFQQLQKWATGVDLDLDPKKDKPSQALRIAAIRQLGAFFQGQFGEQFQIPAYELLHALWVNQFVEIEKELKELESKIYLTFDEMLKLKDDPDTTNPYQDYAKLIRSKTGTRFGHAITQAVFGDGGKTIVNLEKARVARNPNSLGIMVGRDWRGINPQVLIIMPNLDMERINLSGSQIHYANFSGSWFHNAHFVGSNLSVSDFSDTKFFNSTMSGASLIQANLSNATLDSVQLHRTDLSGAFILNSQIINSLICNCQIFPSILEGTDIERSIIILSKERFDKSIARNEIFFVSKRLINSKTSHFFVVDNIQDNMTIIMRRSTNRLRSAFKLKEINKADEQAYIKRFEIMIRGSGMSVTIEDEGETQ